jgi:IS30 family transposase
VAAKVPVTVIANQLGRHRSTVYREIGRNRFREPREYAGYFPLVAQDLAVQRRQRLGKLVRDEALRGFVVDRLRACWSPQQIAGRLKLEDASLGKLCHETIYRFVYGPQGRDADLYRLLPKSRRQRRPRYGRKPRSSFAPPERSIGHRPSEVSSRQAFGHWEADLLVFRREHGQANLTSMIERQTRFTVLLHNPSRRSDAVVGKIGQALCRFPRGTCRTITFDRGTEFAAYPMLGQTIGAEAYFCDPRSPWQKGTVENNNGRIRRFLPGERNIAELGADQLGGLVARLNATPRRCLGYRTPQEAFEGQVAALAQAA